MEDREVLLYNRLVQEHRGTSKQVGAGSEASQTARFEVILDVLDSMLGEKLTGLSLLDFGCGKGDLAVYLERQGRLKTVRYIGLDAIKENIEDALGAMPSCDFRLGTWNGDQEILDEPVDLIVFSGTLATTSHDRRIGMYASLLGQARVGVVGNWVTYTPGVIYDGEGSTRTRSVWWIGQNFAFRSAPITSATTSRSGLFAGAFRFASPSISHRLTWPRGPGRVTAKRA